MSKVRVLTVLMFTLAFLIKASAQTPVDTNFYLVNNLNLDDLNKRDKKLLDSTLTIYHAAKEDSTRINLLFFISQQLDSPIWIKYLDVLDLQIDVLFDKKNLTRQQLTENIFNKAKVLTLIARYYVSFGNNKKKAKNTYLKALKLIKPYKNKKSLAIVTDILEGHIFMLMSDMRMSEAYDYSLLELKARNYLKDSVAISRTYAKMGNIYYYHEDYDKALFSYNTSLNYIKTNNTFLYNKIGILVNKGVIYNKKNEKDKALEHFLQADSLLDMEDKELKYLVTNGNVGFLYIKLGKLDKAKQYFGNLEDVAYKNKDTMLLHYYAKGMAQLYFKENNYEQASYYGKTSLNYATLMKSVEGIKDATKLLLNIYKKENKWEEAFVMQKKHIVFRDSIVNIANREHIIQANFNRKYKNKKKKIEEKYRKETLLLTHQKEKQIIIIIAVVICLLLFSYFLYKKYVKTDKLRILNKDYSIMLEAQSKHLKEANKTIVLKSKYKEEFLANMSHEIRTPLNAIYGYSKLMLKHPLFEKQKQYLTTITSASESLIFIINDILDYSKIEEGKIELEKESFNLLETIKKVVSLVKLPLEKKNVHFNLIIDNNVPNYVIGDMVRLEQVLINLLNNAVKFTSTGEVIFKITSSITSQDIDSVTFSVKDTGIGIPQEKQKTIFNKFNQLDSSTTRRFGGTGLGLSISERLVKLHGGKLNLNSVEAVGSEFYFTIDYKISEKKQKKIDQGVINPDGFNGLKILVADDNVINRTLVKDFFSNWNKKVILETVSDGNEVIQKLNKEYYDVVLMDIHMPNLDGIATTKVIRRDLKKDVVIIALTASVLHSSKSDCIAAGMNDFLFKPFEFDNLLLKIIKNLNLNIELKINKSKNEGLDYNYFNPIKILNISNNPLRVLKIVKSMLEEMDEDINVLLHEMKLNDWKCFFNTIHRISNNADYIGNKTLIKLANEIEIIVNNNLINNKNITPNIEPLILHWYKIRIDIVDFIEMIKINKELL